MANTLDTIGGGVITSYNTAAAASVTVTLLTPATGQANRILAIYVASTAATMVKVQVTKNDGTTVIAEIGGVGTGLLGAPILFPVQGPNAGMGGLCCVTADAAKVIVTTTAGNPTSCSVIYTMAPVP